MSETRYESRQVWHGTGEGYVVSRVTDGKYRAMTSHEVCTALARVEALERERDEWRLAVEYARSHYPEDVFLPDGQSRDAKSARFARRLLDGILDSVQWPVDAALREAEDG